MRWPGIEAIYGSTLRATKVFSSDEDGKKRWEDLHTRVIEHVRISPTFLAEIVIFVNEASWLMFAFNYRMSA